MPTKTIYVAEDDVPLFERAQELAGANLSAAIVRALRRFIDLEEARHHGFDEIIVLVNGPGAYRRKRFLGQRLVRWLQPTATADGTDILNVYRTAGRRYVLHRRTIPDWKLAWGDPEYAGDPKNWGVGTGLVQRLMSWGVDWETFKVSGTYAFHVFDTLEDLKPAVSNDLYRAVREALDGPEIEDLDI